MGQEPRTHLLFLVGIGCALPIGRVRVRLEISEPPDTRNVPVKFAVSQGQKPVNPGVLRVTQAEKSLKILRFLTDISRLRIFKSPRLDGQSEARSRPPSHLRQVTLPNGWREFLWLIRSSIFVISQAVMGASLGKARVSERWQARGVF